MLEAVKDRLIVSCQALESEPLHGAAVMAKMAIAAKQGGASGIRANSVADIRAIRAAVDLPVIGIIKRDYPNSPVFITATMREIDELIGSGCEMIALDSTTRPHPREPLAELVAKVKSLAHPIPLMADIATLDDVALAQKLGFDCLSTTLHGYTAQTDGQTLHDDDFAFLKDVLAQSDIPVIAEGNVVTPGMYARCMELGAYSCVVGGAITRPQQITARFVAARQHRANI